LPARIHQGLAGDDIEIHGCVFIGVARASRGDDFFDQRFGHGIGLAAAYAPAGITSSNFMFNP
jgi:hypothetical protein